MGTRGIRSGTRSTTAPYSFQLSPSTPKERLEGYFRHEWMLATERRHHMAEQKAFLVPVVIDPFILRYKNDPRFAAFCRKVGLPVPGEAPARKSA